MNEYIFIGIIHPQRVDFSISGIPLNFKLKCLELGINGETNIEIKNSKIKITFNSNNNHSKDIYS